MAEYIKREALLKVLRGSAVAKYPASFAMGLFAAASEVERLPAADVVEVVRCKDCEYGEFCLNLAGAEYVSCKLDDCSARKPEEFCSYGERKNDD